MAARVAVLVIFGIITRNFVLAKTEIKISPKSITLQEGKTQKLELKGSDIKTREK